jgi:hypothetical protein
VNGNMTACADCGVIIIVPPPVNVLPAMEKLTGFVPSWPGIE